MYIRLWAHTDDSNCSVVGLHYARALVRFAPVRLCSVTGWTLHKDWGSMSSLIATPMAGDMVNVVCTTPNHWVQTIKVGMPESDTMHASIAAGKPVAAKVKTVPHVRELWTAGARNVLIALDKVDLAKCGKAQAETANRYDALIMDNDTMAGVWDRHIRAHGYQAKHVPTVIRVPVKTDDFKALRELVLER